MIGDLIQSWYVPLRFGVAKVFGEAADHFQADGASYIDVVRWMGQQVVDACEITEDEDNTTKDDRVKRIITLTLALCSCHATHSQQCVQSTIDRLAGEPAQETNDDSQ